MKKLTIYIVKEQLYPFLTGFLFFTFIFMLQQMFSMFDLIINKNVEAILVAKLFLIMLPVTMNITIPMSVLFSAIMAMARLSGDSEIVALRACGTSVYRIIKPVIISGFAVFILMSVFNETLLVYSSKNYNKIFIEILKSSPSAMLEDGIFTGIGNKTIRADEINKKSGKLTNVMIFNKNDNQGWDIITAKYGQIKQNEDGSRTLKLYSGKLFSNNPGIHSFSVIDFSKGSSELLITESKIEYNVTDKTNPSEMNSIKLYKTLKSGVIKNKRDIALCRVEFYKKLSLPFSCLVFVIIGAPVGISTRRSARGIGFGLSIVIIFIYYILLMLGQSFAVKDSISPFLGVWIPNFILLAGGVVLILQKERA